MYESSIDSYRDKAPGFRLPELRIAFTVLKAGDMINPQDWISGIKAACSGINYLTIQVKKSGGSYDNTLQLDVNEVASITESNITVNSPS